MTWSRAALLLGILVAAPLGYMAAAHPIDVAIYRDVGAQILRHDYQLYSANASTGFRYAPIVAFLFAPLALVPLWAAAFAIFILKVFAVVVTVRVVARLTGLDREGAAKTGVLAVLVTSGYLLEEFRTGNLHFLVLFAIVVAMSLAERGRIVLPSLLIALITVMKISPLIFVGFFLATRRFTLAAGSAIALVILFLLPAAFVGVSKHNELVRAFVASSIERTDEARNHSLKGALARFLSDEGPDAGVLPAVNVARLSKRAVDLVWYAADAVMLALLGGILLSIPRGRGAPLLEYSLVTTAMLVVSPFSLRIYFATLFLPCAALLAALVKSPAEPRRRAIVSVLLMVGAAGTVVPLVPGRRWSLLFEALSPHFIAAVAVAACLVVLLRSQPPHSAIPAPSSPSR